MQIGAGGCVKPLSDVPVLAAQRCSSCCSAVGAGGWHKGLPQKQKAQEQQHCAEAPRCAAVSAPLLCILFSILQQQNLLQSEGLLAVGVFSLGMLRRLSGWDHDNGSAGQHETSCAHSSEFCFSALWTCCVM